MFLCFSYPEWCHAYSNLIVFIFSSEKLLCFDIFFWNTLHTLKWNVIYFFLFCFGSGYVCCQHQNFRFHFWNNTNSSKKYVWTEFVLKISKSHHLSQNSNSCIFCLLREGTAPEGSIFIIEIAVPCDKQIFTRTDVNGAKFSNLLFLIVFFFFPPYLVSVNYLLGERWEGEKYWNKYLLFWLILSQDKKRRDLS